MRRIFHATTAIVASLSLLAPDLVAAQQAGNGADAAAETGVDSGAESGAGAEIAPRKPRNAQNIDRDNDQAPRRKANQGDADQEVTEAPAAEAESGMTDSAPAASADQQAPRKRQAAGDEAEPGSTAATEDIGAPSPSPEAEAPAEKPRAVREATPERPARVQREVGDSAPDAAPRQGRRGDAPPKAAPKSDEMQDDMGNQAPQSNAQDTSRPTPRKPEGQAAENDAPGRDRQPTRAGDQASPSTDPAAAPDADAPIAADANPPQARGRGERSQPAADAPVGEDPDALRRGLDEQAAPDTPDARRPPEQAETRRPRPGRYGAADATDSAGRDGSDQPVAAGNRPRRAPDDAPEAGAQETDAARAAANPKPAAPSAALRAVTGDEDGTGAGKPRGQVTDFTVTAEDARRSDQDFDTSVARGLDADQIRELTDAPEKDADEVPAKQQAKDRDDDRGRDLARLALAGLAGYAVGSWMSNDRQVALNTGDRVVVTLPDGSQQLIKNDDTLLFRPGSNVQTERYEDGSSITTVIREDGSRVVTIRDANMNILRRSVVWPDGRSTMLIDDTADVEPVRVSDLPPPARPVDYTDQMSEEALRDALMRESGIERRFTLGQIRDIAQVRALVAPLDIQSITFDTGSAAITPNQAEQLSALGRVIAESVRQNPGELYLIEGHTDAVGSDASNLALSDRRAESVALALTEYFDVPPENMVVQGYGEQFLRVQTSDAERANRRVAVRRITDLIEQN